MLQSQQLSIFFPTSHFTIATDSQNKSKFQYFHNNVQEQQQQQQKITFH